MFQPIYIVQLMLGLAFALSLLGWCLYRLAVLFGMVRRQTKPTKPASRLVSGNQTGQEGRAVSTKGQMKADTNLSRRVLYTAKRERN